MASASEVFPYAYLQRLGATTTVDLARIELDLPEVNYLNLYVQNFVLQIS